MRKSVLLFLSVFLVITASCQQPSAKGSIVKATLSSAQFSEKITSGNILLLDVRTPEEFSGGHLRGAKNIDYTSSTFKAEIQKLDKTKTVYVYCLAGKRSEDSMDELADAGFKEIYNLEGGTLRWLAEGRPMVNNGNVSPKSGGMSAQEYITATRSAEIVIMDFNAVWCGPCKQLSPILDSIEQNYKGRVKVVKVDVDANRVLAQSKSISNIPFLEIYKKGTLIMQHEGLTTYEDLVSKLQL